MTNFPSNTYTTSQEKLNIIFPVRNEEKRLRRGIEQTHAFMQDRFAGAYQLTIVDNDSSDSTSHIAEDLCREYAEVSYSQITQKGVGAAFRAGVEHNTCPLVGYMDIDLATDLNHIEEVFALFHASSTEFVNGSRWAHGYGSTGRGIKRTITSMGLTALLKMSLDMKASDAICGFKFFRKEIIEALIDCADREENGWFFIIEILLLAERSGVNIYELPVSWKDDGNSSVQTIPIIKDYVKQIVRFRKKLNTLQ